ncbi:hypothetical protein C4565_00300 [Candidatus Parcubacteria bacterium]|nr:MAG: hypothetical protein C4565_00300 [Candidatus Parcubacteria bacterium]
MENNHKENHCEWCMVRQPLNGKYWTAEEFYNWFWENPVFVEMELVDNSYPYPEEEKLKLAEMWKKTREINNVKV